MLRGWAGLAAQDLDEDLAKYFKVKESKGALISSIMPSSPSEKSKLKVGDVITLRPGIQKLARENMESLAGNVAPDWMEVNPSELTIRVVAGPV